MIFHFVFHLSLYGYVRHWKFQQCNCGCWELQEFNPNLTGSQRQFEMSFTSVGLWKWWQIYKHGLCLMSSFFRKSAMKSQSIHFWKPKGEHWLTLVTPWMGDCYVQGYGHLMDGWLLCARLCPKIQVKFCAVKQNFTKLLQFEERWADMQTIACLFLLQKAAVGSRLLFRIILDYGFSSDSV